MAIRLHKKIRLVVREFQRRGAAAQNDARRRILSRHLQNKPERALIESWFFDVRATPHLHFPEFEYIALTAMLATPELIRESSQLARLEKLFPRWRGIPLYQNSFARTKCRRADIECFRRLPLLAKQDMRGGFPKNFLSQESLESLLEKNLVELEHTSGTTAERLPVIFGRGWWNAQEERALRLNSFVAKIFDEFPNARRATIVPPACNGFTCPTVWQSAAQRKIENTLFINLARIPFLLSETELARMAAEISDWSPQFLDVDPVHGARFA